MGSKAQFSSKDSTCYFQKHFGPDQKHFLIRKRLDYQS